MPFACRQLCTIGLCGSEFAQWSCGEYYPVARTRRQGDGWAAATLAGELGAGAGRYRPAATGTTDAHTVCDYDWRPARCALGGLVRWLTLSNEPNGTAVLAGLLVDQAALFGVLMLICDLGVPLIAVEARAALDQPAIVTFDTCAQAG